MLSLLFAVIDPLLAPFRAFVNGTLKHGPLLQLMAIDEYHIMMVCFFWYLNRILLRCFMRSNGVFTVSGGCCEFLWLLGIYFQIVGLSTSQVSGAVVSTNSLANIVQKKKLQNPPTKARIIYISLVSRYSTYHQAECERREVERGRER